MGSQLSKIPKCGYYGAQKKRRDDPKALKAQNAFLNDDKAPDLALPDTDDEANISYLAKAASALILWLVAMIYIVLASWYTVNFFHFHATEALDCEVPMVIMMLFQLILLVMSGLMSAFLFWRVICKECRHRIDWHAVEDKHLPYVKALNVILIVYTICIIFTEDYLEENPQSLCAPGYENGASVNCLDCTASLANDTVASCYVCDRELLSFMDWSTWVVLSAAVANVFIFICTNFLGAPQHGPSMHEKLDIASKRLEKHKARARQRAEDDHAAHKGAVNEVDAFNDAINLVRSEIERAQAAEYDENSDDDRGHELSFLDPQQQYAEPEYDHEQGRHTAEPEPVDAICPQGHPLVDIVFARDNGWSCSGMNESGGCLSGCTGFDQSYGWHRYRCQACDYDLCRKCCERHLDHRVKTIAMKGWNKDDKHASPPLLPSPPIVPSPSASPSISSSPTPEHSILKDVAEDLDDASFAV